MVCRQARTRQRITQFAVFPIRERVIAHAQPQDVPARRVERAICRLDDAPQVIDFFAAANSTRNHGNIRDCFNFGVHRFEQSSIVFGRDPLPFRFVDNFNRVNPAAIKRGKFVREIGDASDVPCIRVRPIGTAVLRRILVERFGVDENEDVDTQVPVTFDDEIKF